MFMPIKKLFFALIGFLAAMGQLAASNEQDIIKDVLHQGKSDSEVLRLIAKQDNLGPITYTPLVNLDAVVVVSNGRKVVSLDALKRWVTLGHSSDPLTRERLSARLLNVLRGPAAAVVGESGDESPEEVFSDSELNQVEDFTYHEDAADEARRLEEMRLAHVREEEQSRNRLLETRARYLAEQEAARLARLAAHPTEENARLAAFAMESEDEEDWGPDALAWEADSEEDAEDDQD